MLIFGGKTLALFDLWSLEHFFTGCNSALLVGYFVKKYFKQVNDEKTLFRIQLLTLLALELYWECLEYYLEDGASYDIVTYWFQGVEYIGNRLLSDPIVTVLGLVAIRKFPKIKYVAIPFSLIWLYVHLFVFDNCMAVQDMLFGG
jgi:hypothetical protein